jgi:DNA end-binding protein Ku
MALRPYWSGNIRLSLVSLPVRIYAALNRSKQIALHEIYKPTGEQVHNQLMAGDQEVDRDDIVKGYEIEKDHYVVVTDDEIDSVRLESTRTIDIDRFVDAKEIDRLYWNDPYFLVPDGKMAVEAYTVIREAMRKSGRIALGRVVMHTRERLLAIEPRDNGLIAYSLRTHDEVRSPEEAFEDIPNQKADPKMVEIAAKIIEQQEGPFEPQKFNDRYEDALRALIKQKEKGAGRKVTVEEPQGGEVIDLMEALRKSLGAKGKAAPKKAHPHAKAKRAS